MVRRRASSARVYQASPRAPVASLSPAILVTSGNKEAVVGGFMGGPSVGFEPVAAEASVKRGSSCSSMTNDVL